LLAKKAVALGLVRASRNRRLGRTWAAQVAAIHAIMALVCSTARSWLVGLHASVFGSLRMPYFKHDMFYQNEAGEACHLMDIASPLVTGWLAKSDRFTRRPGGLLDILSRLAAKAVALVTDTGLDGVVLVHGGSVIIDTALTSHRPRVLAAARRVGADVRHPGVPVSGFPGGPAGAPHSDDEDEQLDEQVFAHAAVDGGGVQGGLPPHFVSAVIDLGEEEGAQDNIVPFGNPAWLEDALRRDEERAPRPPPGPSPPPPPPPPPPGPAPLLPHVQCSKAVLDAVLSALRGTAALSDALAAETAGAIAGAAAYSHATIRAFLERNRGSAELCMETARRGAGDPEAGARLADLLVALGARVANLLLGDLDQPMCAAAVIPFTRLVEAFDEAGVALAAAAAAADPAGHEDAE